jgi:hypothetical protein
MTAKELFGVGVRLAGLITALVHLPAVLQRDFLGAVPGVAGLILLTRADWIADRYYPIDSRNDDWRVKTPKDFRDS